MDDKAIIAGIDLCKNYSQASFYNWNDKEPESVILSDTNHKYQIPTTVCKIKGKEQWFVGDEAEKCGILGEGIIIDDILDKVARKDPLVIDDMTVMPMELLQLLLDYLIQSIKQAAGADTINVVCVSIEDYNISVLNVIAGALEKLGIPKECQIMSSHTESFIYYAMSMKPDLWKSDVALFDYTEEGLHFHRMSILKERGMKLIVSGFDDYSDKLPYELTQNEASLELLDDRLKEIAMEQLDKVVYSSVYLTGAGFENENDTPGFINYICNRRRAFAGQNLYSKGACYQAYNECYPLEFKDYILACKERITTGIEIKISDRGRDKILRMIRPGINWCNADRSFDFIVDDIKEMELFLSPVDSKEKQLVKFALDDFPSRPNKATRITLSLSFTSDSRCHVMVKDRGFGEFFPSSGRVINEDILL